MKIKIIISLIMLSIWISSFYSLWLHIKTENAKKEMRIKELENKLTFSEIPRWIELIKLQIENAKEEELKNKNILENMQIKYNNSVWYTRCLTTQGELDIKLIENELSCDKDLENFATYNIEQTKINLGL